MPPRKGALVSVSIGDFFEAFGPDADDVVTPDALRLRGSFKDPTWDEIWSTVALLAPPPRASTKTSPSSQASAAAQADPLPKVSTGTTHTCRTCGHSFAQRKTLTMHMRVCITRQS